VAPLPDLPPGGSRRARLTARAIRGRDDRRDEALLERLLATAATGRAMRPRDWWALDCRLRESRGA
jgi:hypothetical protein